MTSISDSKEQRTIKVLDHGSVTLIDWMGDDKSIVDAARISYNSIKDSPLDEKDINLLDYMLRHRHTSPFEQVEFKFIIEMPIFVMRQWVRHRTANLNEWSGRYSELEDKFYCPPPERLRKQDKVNKQGTSSELIDNAEIFCETMAKEQKDSYAFYQDYLKAGISKEIARINLPLSTHTKIIWKMDLHNLFHFLKLRMDSHAQEEIRVFAEAVYELIKPIVPEACKAFENHIYKAVTFSADEMEVLKYLIKYAKEDFKNGVIARTGWRQTRIDEFLGKLK